MNQHYLKTASFLTLLMLLGCQSQKAVLFAPHPQEAQVSQPLLHSTAKQLEIPKVLCAMDSLQRRRPFVKKPQFGLRRMHQKAISSNRAGAAKAKIIVCTTKNRLIRQGTYQQPAEHEFSDLFIPAIELGLLGGILLLVGLFTSGTVLLIGAIVLLIAFLMFILSLPRSED